MGRRRDREPLTPEQSETVERAVPAVDPVVRAYERRYPGLAFRSEAYMRLVTLVKEYDPALSSLDSWAAGHAAYACKDVLREELETSAHRPRRRVRMLPLDATAGDGEPYWMKFADRHDDTAEIDSEDAAEHIVRPLPGRYRDITWRSIVCEEFRNDIAATYGMSLRLACLILSHSLSYLRTGIVPPGMRPMRRSRHNGHASPRRMAAMEASA
jgi:hypothetical protein